MKIAFPCKVDCPTSPIEDWFGQSRHFAIYDMDNDRLGFRTIDEFVDGGSEGLFAAKQLMESGVDVVIAGRIAPNLVQVLESAHIKIIQNQYGSVRDILLDIRKNGMPLT
ncbi:MAG: NifB/NifX family molybdenum-iron cluster-binding protein [Thermoplasmatota archaeon]